MLGTNFPWQQADCQRQPGVVVSNAAPGIRSIFSFWENLSQGDSRRAPDTV